MKRILLVLAALALVAASSGEVASDLETRGFYIEDGSGATADVVGDAVAEAGFAGGRLYVAVLSEEPDSGATFFSDAVLDELGGEGTVLVVAPETVGYASDQATWTEEELDNATDAALDGSSDNDVVVRFVESLTGSDVGVPDQGSSSGGSGGGGGLVWILVIGGGLLALFLYLRSRSNKTAAVARRERLAQFKATAQEKLNAIANDILEMETEVQMSEDEKVHEHYQSASARYAELIDSVEEATDPEALLELTFQLDLAIWELDVAEALLDGKEPPPKPERPKVERPEPGSPRQGPVITQPTRPTFDRRPGRQSSPAGPDLGNILLAILAAQGLGRRSGPGGWTGAPPPGGFGGPGGGGRGGGGGGRIRGGGRRRG